MKSILVLEDDENLRETLVDVLDSLDYRVEGAASPDEAIHFAHEIPFDLIISDVRMAGPVDGLGALEELRKMRPQLRCIVMTGYADEMAPLRALNIRVDDYLYKPFDVQDIIKALDRVKKSSQQNQWYRRALGRFLGQASPEKLVAELQHTREECLKTFFVAVRSGFLYVETALGTWDSLEELEVAYVTAMRTPTSITADSAQNGKDRYTQWQHRLCQKVTKQEFVSAGQRSPEKVDRVTFKRFFERVQSGVVSAEELGLAVSLRRMPAEARDSDSEYAALYQRMWAAPT